MAASAYTDGDAGSWDWLAAGTVAPETASPGDWVRAASEGLVASGRREAEMASHERKGSPRPRPGDRAFEGNVSGGSKGQPQGDPERRFRVKISAKRPRKPANEFQVPGNMDKGDVSGGSNKQPQGDPQRQVKVKRCANRHRKPADEVPFYDDDMDEGEDKHTPPGTDHVELTDKEKLLHKEIEILKLQLALRTKEHQYEMLLKTNEIESLQKENQELKVYLKMTGKPAERPKRKCSNCNELVNHDARNCPQKPKHDDYYSQENDGGEDCDRQGSPFFRS